MPYRRFYQTIVIAKKLTQKYSHKLALNRLDGTNLNVLAKIYKKYTPFLNKLWEIMINYLFVKNLCEKIFLQKTTKKNIYKIKHYLIFRGRPRAFFCKSLLKNTNLKNIFSMFFL